MYVYAQTEINPVVNIVVETGVTYLFGGVYVYTIKFKHETRNTVVNAVLNVA